MWDFETDPEFQAKLDWADAFVRTEVEPLDHVLGAIYDVKNADNIRLVRPLQQKVREQGLWACHLGPELGGPGYGQLKLALLNEILGRSAFAPVVFGTQAPDTGNAEILAHYGTPEQKARYLQPLLDGEIVSTFSMTEPQGGSDPSVFTTRAELVDGMWEISGEKWFSSNARWADFLLVVAITEPDAPVHDRMSMFIVPKETPGLEIVRNVGYLGDRAPAHAYIRYDKVRVPLDHMLGERGKGFAVAQTRLGGGRIHHAMRSIGEARRAFDMMCERALSRFTKGEVLANKQMVQEKIADSWLELEQFRLLVLRTAWLIDKHQNYKKVIGDISAIKAAMPQVLRNITIRALEVHGSLGLSDEMPFMRKIATSFVVQFSDGPTEVHKTQLAKQILRKYRPSETMFPAYSNIALRTAAAEKLAR